MPIELIVDVVLALLLMAVIAAAYILNQRLEALRRGQEEMSGLVERLDQVTNRAQASVDELKKLGETTQRDMDASIAKARGMADELSLITQAGDNLAGRLEEKLSGAAERARAVDGEAPKEAEQGEMADLREALKQAR